MPNDFLVNVLSTAVDDPDYWWDTSRVPLDSIDKRITDLLDLRGKRAVVTGGAGLNLGQACVNRLAGLGADVAVVDLTPEVAATTGRQRWATPPDAAGFAQEATDRWGTNVIAVHGDVMTWDTSHAVMDECAERLGGIDILVNNATAAAIGEFATMTREQIDKSLNGILAGPLYCTRAALDHMIPAGSGVIINIGSEASNSSVPGLGLYGGLKGGLASLTRLLSKELAGHGVRLVGVNAGSMWGPNRPIPQGVSLYARSHTAIQRYQLPEEVANMVGFLASDAASSMFGNMVDMGGGMSL